MDGRDLGRLKVDYVHEAPPAHVVDFHGAIPACEHPLDLRGDQRLEALIKPEEENSWEGGEEEEA